MNDKIIKSLVLCGVIVLGFSSLSAFADDDDDDPRMRGGMMGGGMMGGGMMGGGMMGGGMMGGGMMGGGMMGGGMMGGGMMGGGMMGGGCGMMGMGGHGMMGMGPMWMLDLTAKQQTQIDKIHSELRKQHWGVKRKMTDQRNKLQELYGAEKRDAKKIGKVYGALFDLKRQMIETKIDAHNRMQAVLTAEQRKQLKEMGGGMMGRGMGRGMQGGMMKR